MAQSEEPDLAEAVGTLAREKSAAEQYAVVLSMAAKQDMPRYLRGISLYADAKSEFDGLVTQLVFDLKSGTDLAASSGRYSGCEASKGWISSLKTWLIQSSTRHTPKYAAAIASRVRSLAAPASATRPSCRQ